MARRVGIIMNGVTGRMGMNQHLIRSILAIRAQGGLHSNGDVIWPEPLLVGRSEAKLAALASEHGLERWTTDLDGALADPEYEIYFDAQLTSARPPAVGPRSRPASTCTARSPSRPTSRARWRSPRCP